jgi:hypothetical protein
LNVQAEIIAKAQATQEAIDLDRGYFGYRAYKAHAIEAGTQSLRCYLEQNLTDLVS